MFQRAYLQSLTNRINEQRKFIQVIYGPRQVGKTTLILQILDLLAIPSHYISTDNAAANNTWLEQQWEAIRLRIGQQEHQEFLLVIDEIQKLPGWSETIKRLWDADTKNKVNLKVIILGSSRLMLQQGLTESLAGRFETTFMGHWTFEEMEKAFGWSIKQYVWFGGYPGSASLVDDEERWRDYVLHSLIETSISKDILMLTRVDKPALMKRLFELGCIYSGQILSYNKMLGQLNDAGNSTTLSHYLDLLDTAGLLAGIEKYSGNVLRKRSSSPKFMVYNTALISAQSTESFSGTTQTELWGRMVESAVGAHLLNHAQLQKYHLHYWREGDQEVDFVLERKGKIIALEVKSGSLRSVKGMATFKKLYSPDKVMLIGKDGVPWQEFLRMDPGELF